VLADGSMAAWQHGSGVISRSPFKKKGVGRRRKRKRKNLFADGFEQVFFQRKGKKERKEKEKKKKKKKKEPVRGWCRGGLLFRAETPCEAP